MAFDLASLLGLSQAPMMADPNEIVITGNKTRQVAPPEAEIVDYVPRPSVVQPAYTPPPAEMVDPAAVNPNSPELLDRRIMLFNAQEAQRRAASQAAGQEYAPRTQESLEEFKAKPGLQFGTTGILRDIIGNGVDFLGSLVGRRPSYRKERFMDEIYGWDQPGGFEAAMQRGMQYDPEMTMAFMKNASAIRNADASTASMSANRNAQAAQRMRDDISGAATGIFFAQDPAEAYAQGGREELQSQLEASGSKVRLPDEYNPNAISRLMYAGWGGSEVQRQAATTQTNQVKKLIADNKNELERWKASLNADTRRYVAGLQAETSRGNARAALTLRQLMEENGLLETGRTEDFITGETARTYDTRENIRRGNSGTRRPLSSFQTGR